MHHEDMELLDDVEGQLRQVIATATAEQRLEGLSPAERLKGMSGEELEELRKLLEQKKPRSQRARRKPGS